MMLRIRIGEEDVEFPASVLKVSSLRQEVPKKGPLSVEMVALFEDEDDLQARVIRRYIMQNQLIARQRGH
jgi:hypothetical protein